MLKKIVILFSFLIIANQIIAQQPKISFINNSGIRINLYLASKSGTPDLGKRIIRAIPQKQTITVDPRTKLISFGSEELIYDCEIPADVQFSYNEQFMPDKTYTIEKADEKKCICTQNSFFKVCTLTLNIS